MSLKRRDKRILGLVFNLGILLFLTCMFLQMEQFFLAFQDY